jgi:membrane-bound ClpP family serine protease
MGNVFYEYVVYNKEGFILKNIKGVCCMPFTFLFSFLNLDLAGLEGLVVLLFVLGIVLIVIELLMPGFGLAGGLGILSLIAGVVLAAQVVTPVMLVFIIAVVLLIITGMLFWLYKSATKDGRISRLLLLRTKTGNEEGYNSASDSSSLLGHEGIAVTVLRPTGTGEFAGKKIDVVSDGEFIQKGSPIRIKEVEGFRVVVEKID